MFSDDPKAQKVAIDPLRISMSSDDDDEWVAVQIDGTGMYPKAQKVTIYSPLISMSSDNDDEWVVV
jgi:hypothetical protein